METNQIFMNTRRLQELSRNAPSSQEVCLPTWDLHDPLVSKYETDCIHILKLCDPIFAHACQTIYDSEGTAHSSPGDRSQVSSFFVGSVQSGKVDRCGTSAAVNRLQPMPSAQHLFWVHTHLEDKVLSEGVTDTHWVSVHMKKRMLPLEGTLI